MCKIRNHAARVLQEYERNSTVGITTTNYKGIARQMDNGWWKVDESYLGPEADWAEGWITVADKRGAQWVLALSRTTEVDGVTCDCEEWCR